MYSRSLRALALSFLASLPSAQETFPPATPESVGLSEEALRELTEIAASYVERDMIVGAELLVLQDRKTVWHEVLGYSDRDDEELWSKGTVSNIRSMTKTLTGAALQILIDRGELGIDDLVAEYLTGFQNERSDTITVRQVLSHRAGLPLTILSTSLDEYPSLIAMADAVGERGPDTAPDQRFWYSDAGTEVCGALVEAISGETLDVFVQRELLEPLGMTESFYYHDDEEERRSRIACMYVGGAGQWQRFWNPDEGALYPYAWGSQSLFSTPKDYAKFLAMWMDGGRVGERVLLSPAAIARTLTPVSEMTMLGSDQRFPTSFTGLEVYYGQMSVLHIPTASKGAGPAVVFGHSGSDGTIAWAFPERDLIILFFTQSRGGGAVLRLEEEIDRLLISPEAYAGHGDVPPEFEPYVGIYIADWANHMREEFRVHVKNGNLAIDVPSQMDFELTPPEDGVFTFRIAPTLTAWFEHDDGGKVDCLRIQQGPMVFEAPRKGTPHDEAFREANRADAKALAAYLGEYEDHTTDSRARVLIDGDYLAIQGMDDQTFHLWKVPGDDVWVVRQNQLMSIRFQGEKDRVVSFTRSSQGGDDVVFPRVDPSE